MSLSVALFARERTPERAIVVGGAVLVGEPVDGELRRVQKLRASEVETQERMTGRPRGEYGERLLVEGPQWRVEVAPGMVAVRRSDPARMERAAERALADRASAVATALAYLAAGEQVPESVPGRTITKWSAKSRSRMLLRYAELDFASAGWGESRWVGVAYRVGMVTLTYPGDWLCVAPSASVAAGHLRALRKRWARRWGPLVGCWKREFQRRGAPHFHIGGLVPDDPGFSSWLSDAWTDIVGSSQACKGWAGCVGAAPESEWECICSERALHSVKGTSVDFSKGDRCSDPRRFAHYFSKHGIASVKDYQNEVPAEWPKEEGVGRFWGYWGLTRLTLAVHVAPDTAQNVVRTARRWFASQNARQTVTRWRKVTTVDHESGEMGWKWRKRRTTVPIGRLSQSAGYIVVNDGPALAAQLARAARSAVTVRGTRNSGAGPVGFLP